MAVTTERQGAVTTIILDRPDRRNAIDPETAKALRAAFRAFERDRQARVAVLWGAHGTFCAGADLKSFAQWGQRRAWPVYDEGPMGPTRIRLAKPVIAAVAGHSVAGGFELALWCDLRVVEEDAVMGVFNRRWGIPLIDGGTVRLPAIVGKIYWERHDGIAAPCDVPNAVYKSWDYIPIVVLPDGWVEPLISGVWLGEKWLAYLHSLKPPDTGWDALFAASRLVREGPGNRYGRRPCVK